LEITTLNKSLITGVLSSITVYDQMSAFYVVSLQNKHTKNILVVMAA
jgi:hypothetical protein